jgi:adenylate cyclase
MKRGTGARLAAGILIGLVVGGAIFGLGWVWPRVYQDFENRTYDLRYSWFIGPPRAQNLDDVVIVSVDARSLDVLGKFGKWPRFYYAQAIANLAQAGAKAVGFDMLFTEPERPREEIIELFKETRASKVTQYLVDSLKVPGNPSAVADGAIGEILRSMEYDTEMGEVTSQAGNVFYGFEFLLGSKGNHPDSLIAGSALPVDVRLAQDFTFIRKQERNYLLEDVEVPIPVLSQSAKGVGYVNAEPDADGVIRSVPLFLHYHGHTYPHLGLRLAMDKLGVSPQQVSVFPGKYVEVGTRRLPIDQDGRMLIRYAGNSLKFKYLSFVDAFLGQTQDGRPLDFLKDKVVLVGVTAPGLADLKAVPFSQTFPGVEIYANIIHSILADQFTQRSPGWLTLAIILGIGLLAGFLAMVFKPRSSWIVAVVLLAAYVAASYYLMKDHGLAIEIVRPLGTVFFTLLGCMTYRYVKEERHANEIRGMFGTYMSPTLVAQLIEKPDMLKLGGDQKEITVFFSDVQGFTTISEGLHPGELVALLNEYLTAMTDIIISSGGFVDKYEGDAIMAFWGAPVEEPDHALRGCLCIIAMRKRLAELNASLALRKMPQLFTRFGINSGSVIVGNMGSAEKFAYTAMGDTVNQAARFEPANKEYGTYCMMGETTYEKVKDEVEARELDLLQVKGKTKGVRVFELLARKGELDPAKQELLTLYNDGLKAYKERKWAEGIKAFQAALGLDPADGPSKTYLARCQAYQTTPPQADWDGVFVMKTKG